MKTDNNGRILTTEEIIKAEQRRRDTNAVRWRFVLFIAVWCLYLLVTDRAEAAEAISVIETHTWQEEFAASEDGPARYWPGPAAIEYNPKGARITASDGAAMLQYLSWSWSERTDRAWNYAGQTTSTGGAHSGRITINWMNALQMNASGRGLLTKGFARTHFYASTETDRLMALEPAPF